LRNNTALLFLLLLGISCTDAAASRKNSSQSEVLDTEEAQQLETTEVVDNKIIEGDTFKITENIVDYYHLFGLGVDFNSFKNLDREQVYEQKSFLLQTLNYQKGVFKIPYL
jgi:hypothetical protein